MWGLDWATEGRLANFALGSLWSMQGCRHGFLYKIEVDLASGAERVNPRLQAQIGLTRASAFDREMLCNEPGINPTLTTRGKGYGHISWG